MTQRTQRVVVNGHNSNLVQVQSGVPQGTVLGPLMFLLYINDIKYGISSHLKLFAHDLHIISNHQYSARSIIITTQPQPYSKVDTSLVNAIKHF